MKTRQPELWTHAELQMLPPVVRDAFTAEGIEVLIVTPLRTSNRPLGVITLAGSVTCEGVDDGDIY